MLAAAGAKIASMPLTEVRPSMEAGKLDVAQNSFELLVSLRFQEFAPFVTVGGYSTITVFMPVLIAKSVWASLKDAERIALEDAAAVSNIYLDASQREAQEAAIEVFSQGGRHGADAGVRGVLGLAQHRQERSLEELPGAEPPGGGPVQFHAAELHRQRQIAVTGRRRAAVSSATAALAPGRGAYRLARAPGEPFGGRENWGKGTC